MTKAWCSTTTSKRQFQGRTAQAAPHRAGQRVGITTSRPSAAGAGFAADSDAAPLARRNRARQVRTDRCNCNWLGWGTDCQSHFAPNAEDARHNPPSVPRQTTPRRTDTPSEWPYPRPNRCPDFFIAKTTRLSLSGSVTLVTKWQDVQTFSRLRIPSADAWH